ncbi:MAG: twin-arginine translocase TatA/TatE family subunit [Deltaproteobacteria bacterium TMED126]|jgi:sec-independent protein translocase protein TatB|nr:twin-arginine translocase TatA/TatE family subunit [Candidatus Dadabacteria bacterium]NSW97459.1 twin-arginine translocase TatA/TatE family subunit [Deltaproteobacteria bacterium TMED126]|tara:strand:- start:147 stop:353 length:207 start_codon:yes stop_codon:yes gene_type:complete
MFGLGFSEIILIVVIFIILFGPDEVPKIAKSLSKLYRNIVNMKDDLNESVTKEVNDLKTIKKDLEKKD